MTMARLIRLVAGFVLLASLFNGAMLYAEGAEILEKIRNDLGIVSGFLGLILAELIEIKGRMK